MTTYSSLSSSRARPDQRDRLARLAHQVRPVLKAIRARRAMLRPSPSARRRLVRRAQTGGSPRRNARTEHKSADAADIAAVQGHLEEFLGLPVRINADADPRSGAVTIRYRTLDQLDLICQRLTGGGI